MMNDTIKSNSINFQYSGEQREEVEGYSDYNQYVYDDEGYGEEGEFIFDDEDEEQEQVDYAETPAGFVEEEEDELEEGEDGSSTYSQGRERRIDDEDDNKEEQEDVEERHPYIDWMLEVGLDPWAQNDWALAEEFFAMQNRHGDDGEEEGEEGDDENEIEEVEEADITKDEGSQTREVKGKQRVSSQSDSQSKQDQIQIQQEDENMQDIVNNANNTSS